LIEKPWGGNRLAQRGQSLGAKIPNGLVGESFELSNLSGYETEISPKEKSVLLKDFSLTYLVKYIETQEHLSVQVHPDDRLARELENSKGKTECWFIIDCKPGAGLYLGLKPGVSKSTLKKALENNQDLSLFLNFVPVKKNQFYLVPAGTVHAIGKDILLLEVQQSSGITYRLWDWDRKDPNGNPRELHIEKGMQSVNDDNIFNQRIISGIMQDAFSQQDVTTLVDHADFKLEALVINGNTKLNLGARSRLNSFYIMEGKGTIDSTPYNRFDSIVLLDKAREINFQSIERTLCLWVS
jgi:mannose-6-phosphate isomerase